MNTITETYPDKESAHRAAEELLRKYGSVLRVYPCAGKWYVEFLAPTLAAARGVDVYMTLTPGDDDPFVYIFTGHIEAAGARPVTDEAIGRAFVDAFKVAVAQYRASREGETT